MAAALFSLHVWSSPTALQLTTMETAGIIFHRRKGYMFEGLVQPMHLLLILVIVLVIFGPGKLPELGEGLGKSIKAFKKAMKDDQTATPIEHKEGKKA
jgi:sec-independent protein translocase protein TatA